MTWIPSSFSRPILIQRRVYLTEVQTSGTRLFVDIARLDVYRRVLFRVNWLDVTDKMM